MSEGRPSIRLPVYPEARESRDHRPTCCAALIRVSWTHQDQIVATSPDLPPPGGAKPCSETVSHRTRANVSIYQQPTRSNLGVQQRAQDNYGAWREGTYGYAFRFNAAFPCAPLTGASRSNSSRRTYAHRAMKAGKPRFSFAMDNPLRVET